MNESVSKKYFIYADDDSDDRQTIADLTFKTEPDLDVVVVENGKEVINYLQGLHNEDIFPCFILLDLNMPVMNGLETLQFLKSTPAFKNIPAMVFSTSSNPKHVELAKNLGAESFITKPFSERDLERVTQQFADLCHDLPITRKK